MRRGCHPHCVLVLHSTGAPHRWSSPIMISQCWTNSAMKMPLVSIPKNGFGCSSFIQTLSLFALAEWCLQHYLSSYLPGLVEGSCIRKCFAQGPSLIFTYWCCCLCKASLCIWQREQQLEKSWWRGGGGTKHPAFSPVLLHIVFWTSQIGLNVLIEKIVSTMQMRGGSESASHASNSYVDNLP